MMTMRKMNSSVFVCFVILSITRNVIVEGQLRGLFFGDHPPHRKLPSIGESDMGMNTIVGGTIDDGGQYQSEVERTQDDAEDYSRTEGSADSSVKIDPGLVCPSEESIPAGFPCTENAACDALQPGIGLCCVHPQCACGIPENGAKCVSEPQTLSPVATSSQDTTNTTMAPIAPNNTTIAPVAAPVPTSPQPVTSPPSGSS
mmetsp:Transcript_8842/g.12834  ORF Transcript_8842/g.12834 Transcript_8842/m.12834 type:complete len:201 (+) Transcript_8842:464-1066(+)